MKTLSTLVLLLALGSSAFGALSVCPKMPTAAAVSHQFLTSILPSGAVTLAQPAASDLSNGVTGTGQVVLDTGPTISGPTLSGTVNASGLTASQLVATDASKNLVSQAKGNLTEATSSVLTITGGTGSVVGSGTSVQVKQAATSQSGYLSSTDWNTFNNKQASLSNNTADRILYGDGTAQPISTSQLAYQVVSTVPTLQVGAAASSSNGAIVVGGSGTGVGTISGGGGALSIDGGPLTLSTHTSGQDILFKPATTTALTLSGTNQKATFAAQPIMSTLSASQAVFSDSSKGLVSNAITGTGNVVMSASPTLTGTIGAANETLSGTLGVTGVATFTAQPIVSSLTASRAVFSDSSKGLVSNATTGTGNVVMSASPSLTGTVGVAGNVNTIGTSTGVVTSQMYSNDSFGGTFLQTTSNSPLYFATNNNALTYPTIQIGTGSTPNVTIGSTDTHGTLYLFDQATGGSTALVLRLGPNQGVSQSNPFQVFDNSNNLWTGITRLGKWFWRSDNMPLLEIADQAAGLGSEVTVISADASHNVGIGTTGQTAKLDVNGSFRVRGLTTAGPVSTDTSGNLSSAAALGETHGGTNQTTYATGDTLYASAANTLSKLSGNTSATMSVLTQTGSGSASAAPVWTSTTGTGNVARAISPTFTGTAGFAAIAATSSITSAGAAGGNGVVTASADATSGATGGLFASNALGTLLLRETSGTHSLVLATNGNTAALTVDSSQHLFINVPTTGTNADFLCMSGSGQILIQASACTISSAKYKENVRDFDDGAVGEIMALRPVTFNFIRDPKHPNPDKANYGNRQIGLIAEEVEAVDPKLAVYEQDGKTPKSYRQEAMIALLVKAVQEQQKQIDKLQKRLK